MKRQKSREEKRRSIKRRRNVAAAVAFFLGLRVLFPAVWPTLPFPTAAGLLATFAFGLMVGLLAGSWRALGLTALVIPAAASTAGGVWAGIIALFTAGPAVYLGLLLGIGWMKRRVEPVRETGTQTYERRVRERPAPARAAARRAADTGSQPAVRRPRRRTPVPARP